jgi:serine/threonine-protein kinase RsbW
MPNRLVVELQGNLSEIPALAGQVEAFGNLNNVPETAIAHVNLALDELITNTISYGFDGPGPHRLVVTLHCGDGLISVELLDSGRPFDPFVRDDPDITQPIESRPTGGLGIFLVRKVMDHVDYRHVNGQNRVTLTKKTNVAGT